jgi:hypothetical protein
LNGFERLTRLTNEEQVKIKVEQLTMEKSQLQKFPKNPNITMGDISIALRENGIASKFLLNKSNGAQ